MAVISTAREPACRRGLVGQPLDDHAQHRADHHGQQHGHQSHSASGQAEGSSPSRLRLQTWHVKGHIGAHHDDVAVGEVQHLGNAVYHGVAQGDDGVDASQADAR